MIEEGRGGIVQHGEVITNNMNKPLIELQSQLAFHSYHLFYEELLNNCFESSYPSQTKSHFISRKYLLLLIGR